MEHVQPFDAGSADRTDLLGGKGAHLGEMTRLGLPVPPGLTLTTEACRAYLSTGELPDETWRQVEEHLERLERQMGRTLSDPDDPLLVSVRSGAPVSMPGMMDTVLNLGLNDAAVEGLARRSGERFARDAYRRLVEMFGEVVLGIDHARFTEVRDDVLDAHDVQDATELDADGLDELLEQERELLRDLTGEDLPQDPRDQLRKAIGAVFGSWDNDRARSYRRLEGIADDLGTAVNFQAMVFGNLDDDSATGVAFSRDPSTGEPEPYGDWLRGAQGEDVVAGVRATDDLRDLATVMPQVHAELTDILTRLERHYRDVQDVEFTIERGQLWVLQTRTGKRSAQAAVRTAVDMADEGLIDRDEAIRRVTPDELDRLLHPQFDPDATYEVLTTGLAASPGAASGEVCFTADAAIERAADGTSVILVREETSPEDLDGLVAAAGVLTARGGLVSHAAIVARGLGKPAVCGAADIVVDPSAARFRVGEVTIEGGEIVSIDGATGEVVVGEVERREPQPDERFHRLLAWADERRSLGVRANADTPEDAATALELGAEGIGLCRTEHLFLGDRTPLIRRFLLATDDDDRQRALDELESTQSQDLTELLAAMDGRPVTVRLLDAPLHEFLPDPDELTAAEATGELDEAGQHLLEAVREWRERNPMLGTRAVRLAVLHPELYRMQTRALVAAVARRRRDGGTPQAQVMIPLVITAEEMALAAGWVREAIGGQDDIPVGTMIETPAAALMAAPIAEHATFFSFGTNDLTQATLALSRDDVAARVLAPYQDHGLLPANPFQTMHVPTVGRLIGIAVAEGRRARADLEVGICGEHGGDPDSVAFFHEAGLDYVSCSPYRVPVARLAAAQAALAEDQADSAPS